MAKDDTGKTRDAQSAGMTADDLQEVRRELKAASEKLKALEVRVEAIEQNLLGN